MALSCFFNLFSLFYWWECFWLSAPVRKHAVVVVAAAAASIVCASQVMPTSTKCPRVSIHHVFHNFILYNLPQWLLSLHEHFLQRTHHVKSVACVNVSQAYTMFSISDIFKRSTWPPLLSSQHPALKKNGP